MSTALLTTLFDADKSDQGRMKMKKSVDAEVER